MLPSSEELSTLLHQSYRYPFVYVLSRSFAFLVFFWILRYFSAARVRYFHSKQRLDGKIAIVTGSNRGLGKETVRQLVKRGCTVVMACRDETSAEVSKADIMSDLNPDDGVVGNIEVIHLDVCSFESIKKFVAEFGSKYARLDILIHNAGYLSFFKESVIDTVDQNISLTMATNYFGPFLLTCLLLDKMRQLVASDQSNPSTSPTSSARIIYVISNFYKYATLDSMLTTTPPTNKNELLESIPLYKYFQSKCAAIAISMEFTDRLRKAVNDGAQETNGRDVTFNCVCPGSVDTDLFRCVAPQFLAQFYGWIRKMFFKTPFEGVQTLLYAAISDELDGVSGKYFVDNREEKVVDYMKNDELRQKLWDYTVQIVKPRDFQN